MTENPLAGCRVLLVEDEMLIATLLEAALEDENCTIVGPFAEVGKAAAAAHSEPLDVAVLDINLGGEMVFPVAEQLAARGVPFLLLSGYGDVGLPDDRRHWPVCAKPFRMDQLLATLARLVAAR